MFNSFTLWLHGPAVVQKLNLARQIKAARKLGRLRVPRAIQLLLQSLADPITSISSDNEGLLDSERVWQTGHLVAALVASGDMAGEPLLSALQEKRDDHFRQCVVETLGQIREYRAIGTLVVLLWDEAEGIRKAAADALEFLRWKPTGVETEAAFAAAKFDFEGAVKVGPAAIRPLSLWLLGRGATSHCQCEAARALGRIGDPQAIEPLTQVIVDEKFDSRYSPSAGEVAIQALAKIGGHGIQVVVNVLKTHKNSKIRAAAAKVLGNVDQPESIAALETGLYSSLGVVTDACEAALGSMTTPHAREVLRRKKAWNEKTKVIVGKIEQLKKKKLDDSKMLEEIYQLALSRRPNPEEREFAAKFRDWTNLFWLRIARSKEFLGF